MKPASTLVSAESGSSYSNSLGPRTRSNHWTDTLTSFQKNKVSLECRQAQLTSRLEILERNLPNIFLKISQSLKSGEDVPDIDLESILAESGIPTCPCAPCRHPDCLKYSEYQSTCNKQSHDLQLVYDRRNGSYADENSNKMKCPMACKQNPPACNRASYGDSNSVSVVTSADLVTINKVQELAKQERELKKHIEQLESRERMFIKTLKKANVLLNDPRQIHKSSSTSAHPKGSSFDNPQLIRLQKLESHNKKVIENMNDLREDKKQLVKQTEVLKNQLKDTQRKLGVVQKEVFGGEIVRCDCKIPSSRSFQRKYSCPSLIAKDQSTNEDSVTLIELAKQFEEALEKVQNHGLCNLASLVKAAASTLKELSRVEEQKCLCNCNCDFAANDYSELEETFTCNCDDWGPDELGPSGEWICKNCGGIHYSESDVARSISKQMPDKKMNIKHSAKTENQKKSICNCGCGTTSVPCDCGCNDTKRKLILPKFDGKSKSSRKPVSAISQMSCNLDCLRECVISKSQANKISQDSSENTLKTPDKFGISKKQKSMECVSIDWSDVGEFDTRSVKIGVNISGTPVTLSQCSDKTVDEDKEEGYVMLLKKGKVKIMESKSPSGTTLAHSKSLTKDWQPCVDLKKNLICPGEKDGCYCIKMHDSGNACQYKNNGSLKDVNIQKGSKLADANFLTSCSSKPRYKNLNSIHHHSKIVMSSSSSGQDCFKRHDGNSCDTKIDSKPRIKANQKSLKTTNLPAFSRDKVTKIKKNKFPVQNNKDRLECEGQNPCVDCLREENNVENNASLQNPSWNSDHLCPECWAREKNHTAYPVSQNVEKLCPCGCGFSVDGENETCPCGCGKLAESPPRKDACFTTQPKEIRALATECDCELFGNCKLCACPEDFCEGPKENIVPRPSKLFSNNVSKGARQRQLESKCRQEIYTDSNKRKKLQEIISRCCYSNKNMRNNFDEECSSPTTIKPTLSGLTTAVEILRAKCRNKDSIIAVLAKELRGSGSIDKITKNLATPCLSSTAWDFDKCALYNYLTGIEIVKCDKSAASDSANTIPKPSNFKVVREICGCVLLSWEMPEDISRIKGYKIFVNGYFAAHVRSPTRTEALLDPLDISEECTLKLYAIDIKGNLSDSVTTIYQSCCPGDD
ncbi:uncharacterized protein LOC112494501 isoform X2 [Cephus cinctus]|uniref:Uncharacterized protein LOC112494501 isoform X2 n=1 Tax=Cephus cinctus TaxID=211228 RepID=A0AAJ7RJR2_CEPCN|nr:uncharacterized protein LOC112494501 isoform X2 [Cephus cinctus]